MSDLVGKKVHEKTSRRKRAHQRLRQRLSGTPERPRLSVFKSARYVYAQVINDLTGQTLVAGAGHRMGRIERIILMTTSSPMIAKTI